jgi:hypothetical protein
VLFVAHSHHRPKLSRGFNFEVEISRLFSGSCALIETLLVQACIANKAEYFKLISSRGGDTTQFSAIHILESFSAICLQTQNATIRVPGIGEITAGKAV